MNKEPTDEQIEGIIEEINDVEWLFDKNDTGPLQIDFNVVRNVGDTVKFWHWTGAADGIIVSVLESEQIYFVMASTDIVSNNQVIVEKGFVMEVDFDYILDEDD